MQAYFSQQGFLSESAGLLLHEPRIVIPFKMRDEVLSCIHVGHQGLSKCRERARLSVWWPGISSDLKHKVNQCQLCQINKPTQHKEPLLVTNLHPGPWRHLGVYICEAGGHHYLVVVDYYSRIIEITHLVDMTSRRMIGKLKSLFARFGIPGNGIGMGRHLRTTVSVMASNLVPEWPELKIVKVKDRKAKESCRYFFNWRHGARSLSPLSPGDSAHLKLDGEKEWTTKGIVSCQAEQPRSYYVSTDQGEFY